MTRAHRAFITKLVKDTNIEQLYETLDDSAVRNNWFLYGSRKNDGQGTYKVKCIVRKDGQQEIPNDSSTFLKTLSIRNNPTGVMNKVLPGRIPKEQPRPTPKELSEEEEDDILSRCMKAIDSSRADDYHEWIRIGCILYTIDKENGFERWNEFSKQSYKYDEDYLRKTWSRFKDYNYTIGSLIYIVKQDDEKFVVHKEPKEHIRLLHQPTEKITFRNLVKKCKEKGIKGYTTKSVDELCDVLNIPRQKKNKLTKNIRTAVKVNLVETVTGESQTFKSMFAAAKFLGVNPGTISAKRNSVKTIKSKMNSSEYKVEI